ncbi:RutC family protein [Vanrija pseudolonga]|uniref:RutC family protein n=1 Tax=Vanrija pseudolonga TaxID=143232 RepID=A0AAF0Y7E9_9TREE|nr:RutC family protein [Vanrija pseudolonga]
MTTSTNPNKTPVPAAGSTAIFTRVIQSGPLVFLAGQTGNDPATGKLVPGGIVPETVQAFASIKETLAHAGLGLEDLVSVTIYVRDYPENIAALNELYPTLFPAGVPLPVRTAVGVAALPRNAAAEYQVIAARRE